MKLKMCAGGDCPLWALAALHAATTLPPVVFKQLVEHVAQVTIGEEPKDDNRVAEILKDSTLNDRAGRARAFGMVRWILESAWRAACSGTALSRDLHVLGVPRPHAAMLAVAAEEYRLIYVEKMERALFTVSSRVTESQANPGPSGSQGTFEMIFSVEDPYLAIQQEESMLISEQQAEELLGDLKQAQAQMDQLETRE